MLYDLGFTLVETVGYKMRVLALLSNPNPWVEILILTISLQSVAAAKNSQVPLAKTTKVPVAAVHKVRMSSEYNGQGN